MSSMDIEELKLELKARFGLPPKPVQRLLRVMEVRARAAECGVAAIEAGPASIIVRLESGRALEAGIQSRLRALYREAMQFSWTDRPAISVAANNNLPPLELAHQLVNALYQMLNEDEDR